MKRPLKIATTLVSKSQFRVLQDECDAELKRTGFVDIERGQDLNDMNASTFRGMSDGGHGMEVTLVDPGEVPATRYYGHVGAVVNVHARFQGAGSKFDTSPGFSDAPQARLWALLSQAAHELPRDAELRSLLVDITTSGELQGPADRHGINRKIAMRRMMRLCRAVGVDYYDVFVSARPPAVVEKVAAAPVRRLTKIEIRRLNYTPPRRIGA